MFLMKVLRILVVLYEKNEQNPENLYRKHIMPGLQIFKSYIYIYMFITIFTVYTMHVC